MSTPFSFNDSPGKNVRDGLVVTGCAAVFVLALSWLSVWSGLASARDVVHGVSSEWVNVAEYQPAGYFNAPWYDAHKARDLAFGSYVAKLSDGREWRFYCTPVCLTYWSDKNNRDEWAGGKRVRMYYLQHLRRILRFDAD